MVIKISKKTDATLKSLSFFFFFNCENKSNYSHDVVAYHYVANNGYQWQDYAGGIGRLDDGQCVYPYSRNTDGDGRF